MATTERYIGTDYAEANPDWHVADSPWKTTQIQRLLTAAPRTVCEVGCGVGEILRQLHDRMPEIERLVGYEIAPAAFEMAKERATDRLTFELKDAAEAPETFDVMLVMDVIEHVPDPIGFLERLRFKAPRLIAHIPLDLSAQAVLRPGKLIDWRRRLGHIHSFTPETALATVEDAGWSVDDYVYTEAFSVAPKTMKAKIARIPRRALPRSLTIRLLGGYSILVDAHPA
jgi:SAM-dependent methyltransferase